MFNFLGYNRREGEGGKRKRERRGRKRERKREDRETEPPFPPPAAKPGGQKSMLKKSSLDF